MNHKIDRTEDNTAETKIQKNTLIGRTMVPTKFKANTIKCNLYPERKVSKKVV